MILRMTYALIILLMAACESAPSGIDDEARSILSQPVEGEPLELRKAAEEAGFYWGAMGFGYDLTDPNYGQEFREALAKNFSIFSPALELTFPFVQPERGVYSFEAVDALADFARANGQKMRGIVVIWREDLSAYLGESPTREEGIALLREHIHTVMGHYREFYPDVFEQWDVVNEAFRSDGTLRASDWQKAIGDDFVELAFRFAHEAWPEAELYYNDFYEPVFNLGGNFINAFGQIDPDAIRPLAPLGPIGPLASCEQSAKCMGVKKMAEDFVARGVPIHGIGFQGHIANVIAPDYGSFASWVEELGLRWAVTELDVPCARSATYPVGGEIVTFLNGAICFENQRRIFHDIVKDCVDSAACDTVVQWGVADPFSWWQGLSSGALGEALALDDNYEYKPAAHGVVEALRGGVR
nr:endo-1,4-beta-xylanase [Oceanococcus sp. HetDA_MAG_MS8]